LFRIEAVFRPESEEGVRSLLEEYRGRVEVIAGGTDLLIKPKPEIRFLIDLSSLGLDYVSRDGQYIRIGATSVIASLLNCEFFDDAPYRILKTAARLFGTQQTRNRATVGGNICSAVPSADLPVALIALDAKVEISGDERKIMLLEDFITGYRKTALGESEFLREIQIPIAADEPRSVFQKLCRTSVDLALVNCAVKLNIDSTPRDARIVLGAVAPTPIRARRAERMLNETQSIDDESISAVSEIASDETKPISDLRASAEYRRAMSRVLVERAIRQTLQW